MNSPGRVVVGIDGTTEGLRALDVAIDEALRFEHHIELVHIFHEMVPTPLLATYDVLTSREAGRSLWGQTRTGRSAGMVRRILRA